MKCDMLDLFIKVHLFGNIRDDGHAFAHGICDHIQSIHLAFLCFLDQYRSCILISINIQ